MRALGRLLQIVGLVVLPLTVALELSGQLGSTWGLSEMVIMLVFGVVAFAAGRLLEGYAKV